MFEPIPGIGPPPPIFSSETGVYHQLEKEASMSGERTASMLLRGVDGSTELTNSGKPFGGCLLNRLKSNGIISEGDELVMVGDGLGYISEAIQNELEVSRMQVSIPGLDIAPKLITEQQKRNPWQKITQGDCLELGKYFPRPDGIIANEVIADLPTIVVKPDVLADLFKEAKVGNSTFNLDLFAAKAGIKDKNQLKLLHELYDYYDKYDLTDLDFRLAHDFAATNIGGFKLIEQASTVLRPGGWIWLSEFGDTKPNVWPTPTNLGDHVEWSINFDQMQRVAEKLGFQTEIVPLADFIGLKEDELAIIHRTGGTGEPICLTLAEAVKHFPDEYPTSRQYTPRFNEDLTSIDTKSRAMTYGMKWMTNSINLGITPFGKSPKEVEVIRIGDYFDSFYSMLAVKQ